MAVNEYLPYATGVGANVLSPTAYAALAARTAGFSAGTASSEAANTPWRQSSVINAAWAQLVVDTLGVDMLDDGSVAGAQAKFLALINTIISGGSVFASAAEILNLNTTKPINAAGLFGAANFQTLAFGSPTQAWDAKAKGLNVEVVLTANSQLGAITNLTDGQPLMFAPTQDNVGSRVLTYNAQHVFPGNVAPTLSTAPNKQDFLFGFYKSSVGKVIWPGFMKAV